MAEVEAAVVTEFEGLKRGRRTGTLKSTRRQLDMPRELINFLIDEDGNLLMPRTPEFTFHDFGAGTGRVRMVSNVTTPDSALIVQVGQVLYAFDTTDDGPYTPQTVVANVNQQIPVWVNSMQDLDYTLVGNSGNTWKISDIDATASTVSTEHGFASYVYKGRRFVAQRGSELIKFSELNQPETFLTDSVFQVGGDFRGGDWSEDPGSPVGFAELGEKLVIFCTQSIWLVSGTTPSSFTLQRTNSMTGAWSRETIVATELGILYLGGTPRGEMGIYRFTGSDSELVSTDISAFLRRWEQVYDQTGQDNLFEHANELFHSYRWNDQYILSAEGANGDREVYIFDLIRQTWTTFGGFTNGPRVGTVREWETPDRLIVTDRDVIYTTDQPMARPSGEGGAVTLGWHDDENPMGFARFLGVKVSASYTGTGTPDLKLTARVPTSGAASDPIEVTITRPLTTNVYSPSPAQPTVFPLNLRGNSIQFDLEVIPANDDNRALIESVQLVYARKPEKFSRH